MIKQVRKDKVSLLDLCMYYHTSGGGGGGERMFDLIREVSSFQITYFAVVYYTHYNGPL